MNTVTTEYLFSVLRTSVAARSTGVLMQCRERTEFHCRAVPLSELAFLFLPTSYVCMLMGGDTTFHHTGKAT